MSRWGNCPKHGTEYDTDEMRCGCDDGMREDDSGGFPHMVICYRCKGSGEIEIPLCQECNDEYDDSDFE